jgi:hypothetical protein
MSERYSSRMADAWVKADLWNRAHPVGTRVIVSVEHAKPYETVTRSEASALASCDTVVSLANGPVYVCSLDNLKAV